MRAIVLGLTVALLAAACSQKQSTQPASQSAQAPVSTPGESTLRATARPNAIPNKTPVTFDFFDIAVTTSGARLLRLGFTIHNGTNASLLCDASEFSAMLSNGQLLDADTSAADTCDPDTIDAGASAKATMFFNLKSAYTGPVTLLMTVNNKVIGRGLATVR
jgi:hypothetical protein